MVIPISQKAQTTINQYKTYLENTSIRDANVKPLSVLVNANDTLPIRKLAETGKCFIYLGKYNAKNIYHDGSTKKIGNIKEIIQQFFERMFDSDEDRKGIKKTCSLSNTLFMMIAVKGSRQGLVPLSCVLFSINNEKEGAFIYYLGTELDKTFLNVIQKYDGYVGYIIGSGL